MNLILAGLILFFLAWLIVGIAIIVVLAVGAFSEMRADEVREWNPDDVIPPYPYDKYK